MAGTANSVYQVAQIPNEVMQWLSVPGFPDERLSVLHDRVSVFQGPFYKGVDTGQKGVCPFSQRIFNSRRNFRIYCTCDIAVM